MQQQRGTASSPIGSRLRFLATPRWIALEVAVVAFVLACYFLLAPWQFSRSSQHDTQMAEMAAAVAAAPADVADLLSPTQQPGAGAQWRLATATGHFDTANQAYIRLRQDNDGRPAYEVVVPFVTGTGVVLVDRGYVPYQAVQESSLKLPPLPTGTVSVTGRVQPDQTDPRRRAPVTVPDGHTAYTAASSAILDATAGLAGPVYRGFLQLTEDSPGVIDAITVPQNDNSRPFFSYAIQWLSFGAIAALGFGYFVYREFHDPVDGDIYVNGPPQPRSDGDDADLAARTHPRDLAGEPSGEETTGAPPATSGRKRAQFDKSQLYD